jgi:hypothetical protein
MIFLHSRPWTVFSGALLLSFVILAGGPEVSRAWDVNASARAEVIESDNIHRDNSELQENGSMLTQGVGVQLLEQQGRNSFSLSLEGGWETIESSTRPSSDEVYRIDLSARIPWSGTGRVEGSAAASRDTTAPDIEDLEQGRILVTASEVSLLIGDEKPAVSEWQVQLGERKEESAEQDQEEVTADFLWSRALSRIGTLSLEGGVDDGKDDFQLETWRRYTGAVNMEVRVRAALTRSYELIWEKITIEEDDGTQNTSERLGFDIRHVLQEASGWSFEGALGVDSVKTPSQDGTLGPRGEFVATGPLTRVITAETSLGYSTRIQDPQDFEAEWTDTAIFSAVVTWDVSRVFQVRPAVEFSRAESFGEDIEDRLEETVILRMDARWTPSDTWFLEWGAVVEDRESTLATGDLSENRLELRAASIYR